MAEPKKKISTVEQLTEALSGRNLKPPSLDSIIENASRTTGLRESLIRAVISVESGGDPNAVSPKGALGIMQIMPATARSLGITDPFDVRQSIEFGAAHLKDMIDKYGEQAGLAAYNAGENPRTLPFLTQGQIPPFTETRRYVPLVLSRERSQAKVSLQSVDPGAPQKSTVGKLANALQGREGGKTRLQSLLETGIDPRQGFLEGSIKPDDEGEFREMLLPNDGEGFPVPIKAARLKNIEEIFRDPPLGKFKQGVLGALDVGTFGAAKPFFPKDSEPQTTGETVSRFGGNLLGFATPGLLFGKTTHAIGIAATRTLIRREGVSPVLANAFGGALGEGSFGLIYGLLTFPEKLRPGESDLKARIRQARNDALLFVGFGLAARGIWSKVQKALGRDQAAKILKKVGLGHPPRTTAEVRSVLESMDDSQIERVFIAQEKGAASILTRPKGSSGPFTGKQPPGDPVISNLPAVLGKGPRAPLDSFFRELTEEVARSNKFPQEGQAVIDELRDGMNFGRKSAQELILATGKKAKDLSEEELREILVKVNGEFQLRELLARAGKLLTEGRSRVFEVPPSPGGKTILENPPVDILGPVGKGAASTTQRGGQVPPHLKNQKNSEKGRNLALKLLGREPKKPPTPVTPSGVGARSKPPKAPGKTPAPGPRKLSPVIQSAIDRVGKAKTEAEVRAITNEPDVQKALSNTVARTVEFLKQKRLGKTPKEDRFEFLQASGQAIINIRKRKISKPKPRKPTTKKVITAPKVEERTGSSSVGTGGFTIATGKKSKVKIGAKNKIDVEVEFKVMELDALIASNNLGGSVNPKFPKELQPRDRTRVASQVQVREIAADLDPQQLLGDVGTANVGAPIIGPDFVVEAGNGRVIAIRQAFEDFPEKAAAFKKATIERAKELGVSARDLERFKKPILVRQRTSKVDRVKFVEDANISPVADIPATQQARIDAKKISDEMLVGLEPFEGEAATAEDILNSAANRGFITAFLEKVSATELGKLSTKRGLLSGEGVKRVSRALFQRAYKTSDETTERFFESQEPGVERLKNGLLQALASFARVEGKIGSGQLPKELSFAKDLEVAIRKFLELSDAKFKVSEFLKPRQKAIGIETVTTETITDSQKFLLRQLDSRRASAKKISDFIGKITESQNAVPHPDQVGLFGKEVFNIEKIIRIAAVKPGEAGAIDAELFVARVIQNLFKRHGRVRGPGPKITVDNVGTLGKIKSAVRKIDTESGIRRFLKENVNELNSLPETFKNQAFEAISRQRQSVKRLAGLIDRVPPLERTLGGKQVLTLKSLDDGKIHKVISPKITVKDRARFEKDGFIEVSSDPEINALREQLFKEQPTAPMFTQWRQIRKVLRGTGIYPRLKDAVVEMDLWKVRKTREFQKALGATFKEIEPGIWNRMSDTKLDKTSTLMRSKAGHTGRERVTALIVIKSKDLSKEIRTLFTRLVSESTPEERIAAKNLKPLMDSLFNEAVERGIMRPSQFIEGYMSRIWNKKFKDAFREWPELVAAEKQGPEKFLEVIEKLELPENIKFFAKMHRTGELHPQEFDVGVILAAYLRAFSRKAFLEPALKRIRPLWETLGREQKEAAAQYFSYLQGFPTQQQIKIDRNLKKLMTIGENLGVVPAGKFDDPNSAQISRYMTDWFYVTGMGFKVGSPAKNLTQGLLAVGELGFKAVGQGIKETMTKEGRVILKNSGIFAEFAPVLEADFGLTTQAWGKFRDLALSMFRAADTWNRSITYLGARRAFLDASKLGEKGMARQIRSVSIDEKRIIQGILKKGQTEKAALEYAKFIVSETQFPYGRADSPLGFRGPLGRFLSQFMTWPAYHTELMLRWAKTKEYQNFARYMVSAMILAEGTREVIGIDIERWFFSGHRFGERQTPFPIPFGNLPSGISPIPKLFLAAGNIGLGFARGDPRQRGKGFSQISESANILRGITVSEIGRATGLLEKPQSRKGESRLDSLTRALGFVPFKRDQKKILDFAVKKFESGNRVAAQRAIVEFGNEFGDTRILSRFQRKLRERRKERNK